MKSETKSRSEKIQIASKCQDLLNSVTVEPYFFLWYLSEGMSDPVNQNIIYIKVCMAKYNDWFMCTHLTNDTIYKEAIQYTEETASNWVLYRMVSAILPSLFVALALGAVSDKLGRKLPMLLPPTGQIIYALFYLFLAVYITETPLWLQIVSSVLQGLSGSWMLVVMSTDSYLADVVPKKDFIWRLSVCDAVATVGSLFGSTIAALIIDITPLSTPVLIIMATNAICIFFVIWRIKEFVPNSEETKRPPEPRSLNNCLKVTGISGIGETFATLTRKREGTKNRLFLGMICLAIFIKVVSVLGKMLLLFLYVKAPPLNWTTSLYSYFSSTSSALAAVATFFVLPFLKRYLKLHDMTICCIGCLSILLSNYLLSFASATWLVFAVGGLAMFWNYSQIAMKSTVPHVVDADEKGKVFSMIASIEGVAGAIGGLIWTRIYNVFLPVWPGCTFILSGSVIIPVLFMALWMRKKLPVSKPEQCVAINDEKANNNTSLYV